MPMCVVVTRDVPSRFRGFLASCMLEIAPGVYTSPDMTTSVRERVCGVLEKWWVEFQQGSILVTWAQPNAVERQGVLVLGDTPRNLVNSDGVFIVRRGL